jgi:spore coat-associated protein N
MKKAKKALLGTALAGAMVVSAGFGTYSWFTDVKEAQGTIDNGTLTLGMDKNLFTHENFAPSQLLFGDLVHIENTGSLDQILRATYTHSTDKNAGIGKYKVGYVAIKYSEKPAGDIPKDMKIRLGGMFNGATNPVEQSSARGVAANKSNYEVVSGMLTDEQLKSLQANAVNTSKTFNFGEGGFWKLKDNQYIDIMFGVKLMDTAGNEYQGAHYDATFKVEAKQTDPDSEFGPAVDEEMQAPAVK